jgi:hypothetical protein
MARKIIQVETYPANSYVDADGTHSTVNGVFALCNDGSLWLQLIGQGGEWMLIDEIPQGELTNYQ